MSCKGCRDKSTRHSAALKSKLATEENARDAEITRDKEVTVEFGGKMGDSPEAMMEKTLQSLAAAQHLTYEQISQKRMLVMERMRQMAERNLASMSNPMRRAFVEEMVNIINCEEISPAGSSPQQALKTLHGVLERSDFEFIAEIYPGLKEEIDRRYEKLMENRIDLSAYIK